MRKTFILFLVLLLSSTTYARWGIGRTFKNSIVVTVAANDSSQAAKSVADFVCDGTADNVQIQAAIDRVHNNSPAGGSGDGGKILLAAGDYSIAAAINLYHRIRVEGSGQGTTQLVLVNGAESNVFQLINPGSDGEVDHWISLAHMMIQGDVDGNNGCGFKLDDADEGTGDVFLEYVYIDRCADAGIWIETSWAIRIENCIIERCGWNADNAAGGGWGVYIGGGTRQVLITGCHIADNYSIHAGIHDAALYIASGSYMTRIIGNNFYYNERIAIKIAGDGSDEEQVIVANNTFAANSNIYDNTYADMVLDADGVIVTGNVFYGNDSGTANDSKYGIELLPGSDNCIISNNFFSDHGTAAIYAEDIDNCIISDNIIQDSEGDGIVISHNSGADSTYVTIDSCQITGSGDDGIHFLGTQYGIISNCVIKGCVDDAIVIESDGATGAMYCVVSNNHISENGGKGLLLTDAEFTEVSDNYFYSNNDVGIQINALSTDCSITGNRLIDGGAIGNRSAILNIGDNGYIAGNFVRSSDTYYDIAIETLAGGDNNYIVNNDVEGGGDAGQEITDAGSGNKIMFNSGFITENEGTAILLNGNTSVVVAHGLDGTPTVINIVWRENPDNTIGDWWIDALDATNFTLNGVDPGASNLDFGWEVKIR